MDTFIAGKSRRLYKTLICPDKIGIARQTTPLNVYSYTPHGSVFACLASEHPVSSTGQAFKQSPNTMCLMPFSSLNQLLP
ncbi:hypothetical protein ER57_10715 [Smithella sp. SCADC]|jgi:hypothetical protein|nr:hypothetical protein ER57_10715 [Smithella sp. SCADC]HAR50174.1 hypothetical protein [Smithella sp.]